VRSTYLAATIRLTPMTMRQMRIGQKSGRALSFPQGLRQLA